MPSAMLGTHWPSITIEQINEGANEYFLSGDPYPSHLKPVCK